MRRAPSSLLLQVALFHPSKSKRETIRKREEENVGRGLRQEEMERRLAVLPKLAKKTKPQQAKKDEHPVLPRTTIKPLEPFPVCVGNAGYVSVRESVSGPLL